MRYNDSAEYMDRHELDWLSGYREGVDSVIEYVESVHAYPKLVAAIEWAVEQGII